MNRVKRILAGMMALAVAFTIGAPMVAKASEVSGGLALSVPEDKVLTYQAGQENPPVFQVIVTNTGTEAVTNVIVKPELRNNGDRWPFKTDYQKYSAVIPTIEANGSATVDFTFAARDNVDTARYTLQFSVTSDEGKLANANFYVNTVAKPEQNKEEPTEKPSGGGTQGGDSGAGGNDVAMLSAGAGGFSNGGASYSGGDGGSAGTGGSGSVPRVIVTGFDTDPAEVRAGSDFKLTIHLKNTAKNTKVNNMLFDLQAPAEGTDEQSVAPAFLPASGSSSIYLESIPAGGTADISIQLNAKGDLLQKPYSMDMSMKYEDGNAAQIEAVSSVSIPVKQDARFEFSDFEISPESVTIGEEANVMCNLYNLGRIKLYNVKAVFEGKGFKKEQVFVGNVESGASASIDAMLEGEKETKGKSKITMTLSYEDEAGKSSNTTKELQLEVTGEVKDDVATTMADAPKSGGLPIVPIIVIGAIVAAVAIAIIVIRKKKKKIMADEEEELLNELDGPVEDER